MNYASRGGHLNIVPRRLLLDNLNGADVNATQQNQWFALHLASGNGHFKIVQLLLKWGARVDMKNDQGRTASNEASRAGELRIVRLLS